jgi:transposase
MPWKEIGVVEKRAQFVEQWLAQEWTMTELCARHGISRQTGYDTLARYQQSGWEGLEPHSRAPWRHPNQTAVEVEQRIVELRRQHMRWEPRKLKRVLEDRDLQIPLDVSMLDTLPLAAILGPDGVVQEGMRAESRTQSEFAQLRYLTRLKY